MIFGHSALVTIAAGVLVLAVSGPSNLAQANEPTPGAVRVILAKPILVDKRLPWSPESLATANQIIAKQKADLTRAIDDLISRGASTVKVVYEDQPLASHEFRDSLQYGTSFLPWRLIGNEQVAEVSRAGEAFPKHRSDMANYLTRLGEDTCSLRDFSFWSITTWFQPAKCKIVTPSASDFLRASMATAFKKATLDVGSFELSELKFALGPKTHLRIENDELVCPELAPIFGGNTNIPLRAIGLTGGYSISVNLKRRTASFIFLGPDQKALAKLASKAKNQNYVRFF
jgi:hypothetical protein